MLRPLKKNHWRPKIQMLLIMIFGKLPISNDTLSRLQQEDVFCKNILNEIEKGNIVEGQLYLIRDNTLKRYAIDGDNTYETTVILRALTTQILQKAHDELGHNGTHRTYTLHKRLSYWKVLRPSVEKTHQNVLSVPEKK